jgi:hypothetical protein
MVPTAKKLKVSFFTYVRYRVSGAHALSSLAQTIKQRSPIFHPIITDRSPWFAQYPRLLRRHHFILKHDTLSISWCTDTKTLDDLTKRSYTCDAKNNPNTPPNRLNQLQDSAVA